ncbi:hypothetical protein D3C72_1829170 [compost metagenome]
MPNGSVSSTAAAPNPTPVTTAGLVIQRSQVMPSNGVQSWNDSGSASAASMDSVTGVSTCMSTVATTRRPIRIRVSVTVSRRDSWL